VFAVGSYETLKICDKLGVNLGFNSISGLMLYQNQILDQFLIFPGHQMGHNLHAPAELVPLYLLI
jgi:hypothetical protein